MLLREQIHRALARKYTSRWFDELARIGALDPRTVEKVDDAKRRSRSGRTPPVGKVVAHLMLGAWVDLLDRGTRGQYEDMLWPVLAPVFNARGEQPGRAHVHQILKRLNWARNRVNHCEPVVFGFPQVGERTIDGRRRRRSPGLLLGDARSLAGMIDPDVANWMAGWTLIDALISDPRVVRALEYAIEQPGVAFDE